MMKIVMHNDGQATLKEVYERFIASRRAINVSTETISYYGYCYKFFTEFVGEDILANDIDSDLINRYVSHLLEKDSICDITVNSYLRGIRVILNYGMKEDYIKPFQIKLLKVEKKVKPTYTDNELLALTKKPNTKKCEFAEYRNWVIVNFLLRTGVRLATIVETRIGDVDLSNMMLTLRNMKNRKQQFIPISNELGKVIREYLEFRKGQSEDYLFCNPYGEKLTKDAVKSTIASYNYKRGVAKTSIHVFRHTFSKKWILNGGDVFKLQKILGHSTLDITREYVNMFSTDLQQNFESFNPLDRLLQENRRGGTKISLNNRE